MDYLDELERLEREATPGPWYPLLGHPYLFANERGPEVWKHDIIGRFDYNSVKDREFIAAIRNAAPILIRDARQCNPVQNKTPRTDAKHAELIKRSEGYGWVVGTAYVEMREHAEQLERENANLRERIARHNPPNATESAP